MFQYLLFFVVPWIGQQSISLTVVLLEALLTEEGVVRILYHLALAHVLSAVCTGYARARIGQTKRHRGGEHLLGQGDGDITMLWAFFFVWYVLLAVWNRVSGYHSDLPAA